MPQPAPVGSLAGLRTSSPAPRVRAQRARDDATSVAAAQDRADPPPRRPPSHRPPPGVTVERVADRPPGAGQPGPPRQLDSRSLKAASDRSETDAIPPSDAVHQGLTTPAGCSGTSTSCPTATPVDLGAILADVEPARARSSSSATSTTSSGARPARRRATVRRARPAASSHRDVRYGASGRCRARRAFEHRDAAPVGRPRSGTSSAAGRPPDAAAGWAQVLDPSAWPRGQRPSSDGADWTGDPTACARRVPRSPAERRGPPSRAGAPPSSRRG